jgi:general secretion pathway protein D
VEISSNPTSVNIAGVSEPVIAQRVNEADIRMRDGEPAILGGLSDVEDSNSNSGVPGITNIPVLGYLFSSKTRSKTDDQILIALIPHIVRAPDLSIIGEEGVLAGSERVVRVQHRTSTNASGSGAAPATPGGPSGSITPGPSGPAAPETQPFPRRVPGEPGQRQFGQQPEPAEVPPQQENEPQPQPAPPQ